MNSQLTKQEKAQIYHLRKYKKRKNFTLKMLFSQLTRDKILYLEGQINYTNIHFTDNTVIKSAYTLTLFEHILKYYNFARIHKKFIVNQSKIKTIEENEITLTNDTILTASRRKVYILKTISN